MKKLRKKLSNVADYLVTAVILTTLSFALTITILVLWYQAVKTYP